LIQRGDINADSVLAEVHQCLEQYEAALRRHDLVALDQFFLQRSDTVRYGLAEHNYGAEAISHWRRTATPVSPQRRILRTVITTFGKDAASVGVEFESPDSPLRGRQTQLWVRVEDGWKIASAHVSAIDRKLLDHG
jgi:ketosteroid isomerase-like protein